MLSLLPLFFATLVAAVASQTTTTTVINNTCHVERDELAAMTQVMDHLFKYQAITLISLITNQFKSNPDDFNLEGINMNVNLSASVYMQAAAHAEEMSPIVALENGFVAGAVYTNGKWVTNDQAVASPTYALSFYDIDVNTFKAASVPYQTSSVNMRTRPWYVKAKATPNGKIAYTTPFGTLGTTACAISASSPLYNSSGAFVGAIASTYYINLSPSPMPTLNDFLATIFPNANTKVMYVMYTPSFVLLGSSVYATLDCYDHLQANASDNEYIRTSAAYIIDNHINAATAVNVPSMGYSIQVQFYDNEYGIPLTLVSVSSIDTTTTQTITATTTNTYYENVPAETTTSDTCDTQSVMAVSSTSLAFLIVLVALNVVQIIISLRKDGAINNNANSSDSKL